MSQAARNASTSPARSSSLSVAGSKVEGGANPVFRAPETSPALRGSLQSPADLALACRLVGALIDDCPDSTDLLLEAAGDVRTTLRLASMPADKRKSLAALSLALHLHGDR
jgi:hypothetical protein